MVRTIWNADVDIKDWENYLKEEYPDVTDEYEKYELIHEINNEYLEFDKANLNIELDGNIVIIADLGLWNGRRPAYKVLKSCNLADIFQSNVDGISSCHWYSNGKDICCDESHHDGTNHYTYRMVKPGKDFDDIYGKEMTPHRLGYYTSSLVDKVNAVYGWT